MQMGAPELGASHADTERVRNLSIRDPNPLVRQPNNVLHIRTHGLTPLPADLRRLLMTSGTTLLPYEIVTRRSEEEQRTTFMARFESVASAKIAFRSLAGTTLNSQPVKVSWVSY